MSTDISSHASFGELVLGATNPTSVPTELVEAEIGVEDLFGQYAKAFVAEAYRVNPLRAEQVKLEVQEVEDYIRYLVTKRIETVNGVCKDFQKLKVLYIPSFIQFNLAMIGEVNLREDGLKIVPVVDQPSKMTLTQAITISEKIGSFMNDLQIVRDAMPRSIEGDRNVMSTAMIAGYMRALHKVEHVSFTYISRFLGMKLREEAAFQVLYRVQYDDAAFIAAALTSQKVVF